eukprot:5481092-Amphidinium_carterae.1
MGDFDEWVYDQRQKMMTACKANPDHTLRYVLSVENAARTGRDCPEVPKKFRRLSLKLGIAVEKITKKSDLGVKLAVARKQEQEKGRTLSGFFAYHMLLKQYKFSANSKSYIDMKRLQALRCQNDRDL